MDNKIYTLWKLKEGKRCGFGEFDIKMLGVIFEIEHNFNSVEIGGCGLDGTYVITQKNRKAPIIFFNTKSTTQKETNTQ